MRYEYRDIWVRCDDGQIIGCQLSYPRTELYDTVQRCAEIVQAWLMGEYNTLVLPAGYRIWNPGGKLDLHMDREPEPRRGNRAGSDWRTDEEIRAAAIAEYGEDDEDGADTERAVAQEEA